MDIKRGEDRLGFINDLGGIGGFTPCRQSHTVPIVEYAMKGHKGEAVGDGSCTILLIEDDDNDVFLFRRAVRHSTLRCDVHVVTSLEDAQAYLTGQGKYRERRKSPTPNIIVTDLAFRGDSGLSFLKWFKAHPELGNIPVICVTGTLDPNKLGQAARFGAKCIEKTTFLDDAIRVIKEVVGEDRSSRRAA